MPELPEVQTIRNQLRSYLPLTIERIKRSPELKQNILHTKIPKNIVGATLKRIKSHGKLMIFDLGDLYLLSHLGMSGSWIISKEKLKDKHLHLQLDCGKYFLSYVDPRRFGHMYFVDKKGKDEYLKRLGVDISSEAFTDDYVWECLQKGANREIKPFLLDQKYFAGSGNYIANEVCIRAGLIPDRICKTLKIEDAKKIKQAFHSVLEGSLKNNGVTFSGGYRDAFGEAGKGVQNLVVFHQENCGLCGTKVRKVMLKGRGTFYCPLCQS